MRYIKAVFSIFILSIFINSAYSSTYVSTASYLYVPLPLYKNPVNKVLIEPTLSSYVKFETLFYIALAQQLEPGKTCPGNCPKTNAIYTAVTQNTATTSGWMGYPCESSSEEDCTNLIIGKANKYYPKLILLSALDYNAIQAQNSNNNNYNWDQVQNNTWTILPDWQKTLGQTNLLFPCGYINNTNLTVGSALGMTRAMELSYFCYPYATQDNNSPSLHANTGQSFVNKAFSIATSGSQLRPLYVFQGVEVFIKDPANGHGCDAASSYDDTTSELKPFWGLPFMGKKCEDTTLDNLYFMIIDAVDQQ